jgi:RecA/RadA recombinase
MTDGPCTFEAEGIEVIGLVEPVLASSLIEDEELDNLLNSVCDSGSKDCKDEQRRLGTGVKSLDTALSGGLESGRIVEISGEAGTGASEVRKCNSYESTYEFDQ